MKKHLSLLLLALCFILPAAYAQPKTDKAEVIEGPEIPFNKSTLDDVIGHDVSGYFTTRYARKKRIIEHLDKNLKADKSVEVPVKMEYNDLHRVYVDVIMMGKNLFMFSSAYDRKTKTSYFFVQKISHDLEIDPNVTLLMKRSREEGGSIGGLYTVSENGSRILFYRNSSTGGEGSKERMEFTVYDDNMKQLWQEDAELPFPSNLFSLDRISIDDQDNISLTGIEYQERMERRESRRAGKPTYKYHLVSFKDKAKKVKEYGFELDNKFITDVRIGTAPNGDLVAAGLYSDKGSYSVKGAFYMLVDGETRQVKKQKTTEFELDFITQNMSDREKKKAERREARGKETELYEFDLDHLIIQNDGGATLIAEQYYVEVVTTTTTSANGGTSTHTTYHYFYNDIIALSFNNDGSLGWKCKVPKRQHTTNDGGYFSSYAYAAVGNNIYLIFNDNPKNLFLKEGEQPYRAFTRGEIAVSIVQIDGKTGKSSRELLFASTRGDIIIRPKRCEQTENKEMLIYGERRKKAYQFSKVIFN